MTHITENDTGIDLSQCGSDPDAPIDLSKRRRPFDQEADVNEPAIEVCGHSLDGPQRKQSSRLRLKAVQQFASPFRDLKVVHLFTGDGNHNGTPLNQQWLI
jgi:hypothetical protein